MHARARFPSSTQHDTNTIVDGDTTQGIQGNTRSDRGTKPDRCTVSVRKFGTPMLGDTRWLAADCNRFLITTHTKWHGRIVQCLCAVGPRGKGGCLCIGVTLTQTLRPARRQCTFQARAAPRTVSLTVAPAPHCPPYDSYNNHARRANTERKIEHPQDNTAACWLVSTKC